MGRFPLAIFVFLLCAGAVRAVEGIRLSAKEVSTWTDGNCRVFLLESGACITTPGGSLGADAMVVRFDETAAARTGRVKLGVYSETAAVSSATVVTASGGLAIDETALRSFGQAPSFEILTRAARAFASHARDEETKPASAYAQAQADGPADASQQAGAADESPAAEAETKSAAGPPDAPQAAESEAASWVKLPEGESVITYSPIDADYYDSEMEKLGRTTRIVITGGIEIALGEYKMRAGNMVIYAVDSDEGKVSEIQIYAEDNVKFIGPGATLEADRLFYDYAANNALLVNAALYTQLTQEGLPLVLRAHEVRSYAGMLYKATNSDATTCEFGKPHYRLSAKSTSIIPARHPDGTESALVIAKGNKFYIGGVPVLRWPKFSRDIKETYTPLKRLAVGNSDNFGNYVYTTWNLFDFFGGETSSSWVARASRWSQLEGSLDYRSKRGTGTGLAFKYDRPEIRGELDTYYIKDRGTDGNGFLPPSDDRGRARWQQRAHYEDYQIDTELSHISDRGFLPEYYEREIKEEKPPETYLYVKRPWEHAQAEFLYRPRLNDFQTQTEYLPQGRLDFAAYPLWGGRILYNSTTRADNVAFRPDYALAMPSYRTQRLDTIHGFEAPFASDGGFTVTPFATARGSYWDDIADGDRAGRFAGSAGAKVALPPVWRTFDVSSSMLNIDRLRHVVNFDVTYEDVYNSTRRPTELLPFDEVETVDEVKVATLALRQRLQTKRDPAAEGGPKRTVNLLGVDAEADYFPDARRDNAGHLWSDLRLNSRAALTDDVSVITDGDYDTYENRFDKAGVWVRIDHSPRTTFSLGNRYIRTVSSSVMTATMDHVITDRWELSLVSQYDFDHGQMLDDRVVLRRRVHEFAIEFKAKYDKGRNDTTFGVDVYPLGVGGIRRF